MAVHYRPCSIYFGALTHLRLREAKPKIAC
jgi:hypothetical protein